MEVVVNILNFFIVVFFKLIEIFAYVLVESAEWVLGLLL